MSKGKFPGWRTMTAAQRYNAKMDAMFADARARGVTGLYSGPAQPLKPGTTVTLTRDVLTPDLKTRFQKGTRCTYRGWSSLSHGEAALEVINPNRSDSFCAPPDAFTPEAAHV